MKKEKKKKKRKIREREDIASTQSEFQVKTSNLREGQKKARDLRANYRAK